MIARPVLLEKEHNLDGFDCGNAALDDWLKKYAKQSQNSGSVNTFVVLDIDIVIGYYSLTVGQVDKITVTNRISQGMGNYPIPVVILARMAVNKDYQGKNIGSGMLKDAICRTLSVAQEVGVRAILTHPIDDQAEQFYIKFGFEKSPIREKQCLLLLKDAKKIVM